MEEDKCDTALGLAIRYDDYSTVGKGVFCRRHEPEPPKVRLHLWFPSSSTGEDEEEEENAASMESEISEMLFPVNSINNKRDCRDDDGDGGGGARKKLRLSPEQSTLLEDKFRAHSTLTSLQKQELANKLGIRPRQVEVWFQNRRARIKLKQTEVECEVLKGWCESLREENKRLRKEMQELRFSAIMLSQDHKPRIMAASCQENDSGCGGRDLGKEARNLSCAVHYLCK